MVETVLWADRNYRVSFDDVSTQLIYRIKIPLRKYARPLGEKKLKDLLGK